MSGKDQNPGRSFFAVADLDAPEPEGVQPDAWPSASPAPALSTQPLEPIPDPAHVVVIDNAPALTTQPLDAPRDVELVEPDVADAGLYALRSDAGTPPAEKDIEEDEWDQSSNPTRVPNRNSDKWLIGLALIAFAFTFAGLGGYWWWTERDDPAKGISTESTDEQEPISIVINDPPAIVAEPEIEVVEPEEEATPEPAVIAEPKDCVFLNGSRPTVGDKHIVRCQNDTRFLAISTYTTGGVFIFSDYEFYEP